MKNKLIKLALFVGIPAILFAASARIKDFATTATSAAGDDYIPLDGATNGTRKILGARFLTNSTVTGTGNVTFDTSPTITSAVLVTPTLGVAAATSVNTTRQSHGAAGATETFDLANGDTHTATLDANLTVTLSGWAASGRYSSMFIGLLQDGTGGRTVTWPGAVVTAPTITTTAGAITWVSLWTTDGGTTIYASGTADGVSATSTATLTNKTFDAGATGNVLKAKGYIYLTHPHLADGTNATIGTTATSIAYGHATFSNSVDEASNYVEYYIQVPEDIDTSVALRARIKVLLGNTDTGTHRYVLSSVSVADSAVPTASTLANAINVDFAGDGSGANGDVETSAWTTLTSWAGALTAGQTWRIRFARDGNATEDGSTVNSTELGLVIEYGLTQ